MISHHTKVHLLLSSFTFFWIWQIVQPVFDEYLPSINIGPHTNLTLSISEVISQYLGAGTLLSGYALYSAVNYGQLSFGMNIAFMLPAFMIASGHGVHVACVTIQIQMTKKDPLHALVYFLHEHWSHNTFLIGFYGLVALLIWSERCGSKCAQNPVNQKYSQVPLIHTQEPQQVHVVNNCSKEKLATTPKPTADSYTNSSINSCQGTALQECDKQSSLARHDISIETIPKARFDNHKHKNGTVNHSTCNANGILATTQQCLPTNHTYDKKLRLPTGVKANGEVGKSTTIQGRQMGTLFARFVVLWTTWVMPIIMGVYFSVFASLTSTKPVTTLFYLGVLSFQMISKERHSFYGLSDFLKFWNNEMIVGGFFTKAVLIGLPLMLVNFE